MSDRKGSSQSAKSPLNPPPSVNALPPIERKSGKVIISGIGVERVSRLPKLTTTLPQQILDPRSEVLAMPGLVPLDIETLETTDKSASLDHLIFAGSKVARDKRIITKEGTNYVPLFLAAWMAQTSEQTLRNWIDKGVKFNRRPIQTYISPATSEIYISEPSLRSVAERFVKWPSKEPAGAVTLGETEDQTGFLGLPDAARMVGKSKRTMWLWATQGKAPTAKPLDVIQCTVSDHFYIRQKDIAHLQTLERPTGLKPGPKPRNSPHP